MTLMLDKIFSLQNKTALITGASRGIGRAIAEVFGKAGARLAIVALNAERLAQTAKELRAHEFVVMDYACDVSDAEQVQRAVEKAAAQFGRIDVLVNNAGILQSGHITDFSASDWERMLAVNLNSAFYFSRAVAPLMMEQKFGRIINVSSISAYTGGVAGSVQYAAAKGGMISMVKLADCPPGHTKYFMKKDLLAEPSRGNHVD